MVAAGTGYTGEDGVEISVPATAAEELWQAVLDAGVAPPASAPATPCASRPGCPCTATSSGPGITPLQANLGWVVAWDKPSGFRGREALLRNGPGAWPAASGVWPSPGAGLPGRATG